MLIKNEILSLVQPRLLHIDTLQKVEEVQLLSYSCINGSKPGIFMSQDMAILSDYRAS
jgi:hypothetical protein